MKKQVILAAVLLAAGIATAQAAFTFAAGPTIGQIDGLGYHNKGVAGLSIAGAATWDRLTVDGALTRLGGGSDAACDRGGCITQSGPRWLDAGAGVSYAVPLTERLTVVPRIEIGRSGFMGSGAHTDYLAAGAAALYGLTPRLTLVAQLMHGRTDGVNSLPGGQYQSAGLGLVERHPLGLPGDVSLTYSRRRWFVDTLPFGGDQYMRESALTLGYSRAF